ncbi:YifB family Mg chelatase-like AAA ATPase [Candidatus Persebacteraceae bacterium Df01]|jgi:magnesium chelatase family protein|uniref:YifB family Mg chelatase-like AAA ATPase n=1 Tax=Candidatus Doriopsillibacter californiensis TaxID=2970740 RepID=A0ABT7QJR5_9GAMM|nr:YifB family Mg chelatase-like AAA ATPase [Candidatus Persebacteraceae bacterium Df01]
MALAILHSRALTGVYAAAVTVEVHLSGGLPQFNIVGLPDTEVREARDRVRAAILNSRFQFPARRITINLAPADMPKEGGRYDLPIALGILSAAEQIPTDLLEQFEFAGELALDGKLRSCGSALPITLATKRADRAIIMPPEDAAIGALATGAVVLQAHTLLEVCAHLAERQRLPQATPLELPEIGNSSCFSDVKGQVKAKRALEIAAAGGHSLLMMGPPGCGKSMLAARLSNLMPPLTDDEALESAAVRSLVGGDFQPNKWRQRPFRSPHHSASAAALIGGGSKPRPGEISLSHHGVLFLDELPEFDRQVLEVLREPLESGMITVSRAARKSDFPAAFQLVTAMNPCPCGYLSHPQKECNCTPNQISRYRAKISGPLLDRIDMHIEVESLSQDEITGAADGETSATVRARVTEARAFQTMRQNALNARLPPSGVDVYCIPNESAQVFARQALKKLGLSARSYHRVLKMARTIADLAQEEDISTGHLSEAIQYRRLAFDNPLQ